MKKRKPGRKLSRVSGQRKALLRTMTLSLASHQQIKTTLAKAKELRPYIERKMTHAKAAISGSEVVKMNKIRLLKKELSAQAVAKLLKIAELFKSRQGGYVRIMKTGLRKSDFAPMAVIEWTEKVEEEKKEKKESKKESKKEKKEEVKK